jgi:hypothetical protein
MKPDRYTKQRQELSALGPSEPINLLVRVRAMTLAPSGEDADKPKKIAILDELCAEYSPLNYSTFPPTRGVAFSPQVIVPLSLFDPSFLPPVRSNFTSISATQAQGS